MIPLSLNAQHYSTDSKKAIKLFEKAEEAVIDRDFETAIKLFATAIDKDVTFKEAYLKLAAIYALYQDKENALYYYDGYAQVTPHHLIDWRIWKNLAYLNFAFGHYDKAQQAMTELLKQKPEHLNDPDLELLKRSIDFSVVAMVNTRDLELNVLPETVNSFALQYFPVLTVDGNTLIYTKRDTNRPGSDEDIVFSVLSDSGWSKGLSISPEINTDLNEGACTVSADGRTLVFTSCDDGRTFGSCDLFMCKKEGDQWSKPINMGDLVNSPQWDSQPALSADGRQLYFSSNRPGGYGKRDLWVTTLKGEKWSKPVNLGKVINGFRDETTPFIHANNDILVYSSNSYPGLGGYDLFYSKKENNIWGSPINLGSPINSFKDEVSLFIASDGEMAYYSKERMEKGYVVESNIVSFRIPFDSFKVDKASYVTGIVRDEETLEPLRARLKLMNLNDSTDEYVTYSDAVTGSYFLTLSAGNEYGVFVDREGYLFENLSFESRTNELINPDTINIDLKAVRAGESVVLKNIYFEFDKYELDKRSKYELQSIVQFLNQNKNIHFQIEGHTDNRGDAMYNQLLSEKRAESVYNYLKGKGISPNRMSVKGFGASEPLMKLDTEFAHKTNRRITFKVLK